MREKLMNYARKRDRREREEAENGFHFHSRSYHHYFEGYTEAPEMGPGGKIRFRRVYTGVYHLQDLPRARRVLLRLAYVLLFAAAVLLFLFGASRDVGSNRAWYVAAAEVVSLAGLFWTLCTLVNYLTAPRKLTIHDYRTTSGSIQKASLTAAAGLLAAAVLTALYAVIQPDLMALELVCALALFLASALCAGIFGLERRTPYTQEESGAAAPKNGVTGIRNADTFDRAAEWMAAPGRFL